MVQHWDLVNLDSLARVSGGILGQTFCRQGLCVNISHFIIPSWSEKSWALLRHRHPRTSHSSDSPASGLLRLPNELLVIIFQWVDRLVDAVCLCLADGRLLSLGLFQVLHLQKSVFADWAGDRVVFLGDCTRDDDYPVSLQQLVHSTLQRWPISNPETFQFGFSFLITNTYIPCTESTLKPSEYHLKRNNLGEDQAAFEMLITPRYHSSQPWILRNLSKNDYVRADAIASLTKSDGATPFIKGAINLGHALLSRICWSSDSHIAMKYGGDLHRGPWAGDRFEVTTMDKLKGEEWRDISDEVVEILEHIWKSEYGDHWRERIQDVSRTLSTIP